MASISDDLVVTDRPGRIAEASASLRAAQGRAVAAMRSLPEGQGACVVGRAHAGRPGQVTMRTLFGGARIVDMLVGEQLPRIC